MEIASKSEKIKENCTFFFEQPIKWHPHLAKNTSTLNTIWEKSEENKVQRKKWKQKNKKERKERKKKERFLYVSLAHVYVRAHSNRNVVFLLSQVSHRGRKIGVNSIEKWENSGKSKKKQRGKMCFSLWFRVLFGQLPYPFVKFPSTTTHNSIENNDLARSLWHLWQQKDKTPCQCARTRAREKVCL